MSPIQQKILHDLIASLLGLSGDHVINSYQNATRPSKPYASIGYRNHKTESRQEIGTTDTTGNRSIIARRTVICEIQLFSDGCMDPNTTLANMVDGFGLDSSAGIFRSAGFAVYDADPIMDISAIDSFDFEKRAAVDLHVRYNSVIADAAAGVIEGVQIVANVGDTPQQTITINESEG